MMPRPRQIASGSVGTSLNLQSSTALSLSAKLPGLKQSDWNSGMEEPSRPCGKRNRAERGRSAQTEGRKCPSFCWCVKCSLVSLSVKTQKSYPFTFVIPALSRGAYLCWCLMQDGIPCMDCIQVLSNTAYALSASIFVANVLIQFPFMDSFVSDIVCYIWKRIKDQDVTVHSNTEFFPESSLHVPVKHLDTFSLMDTNLNTLSAQDQYGSTAG